MWQADPDAPVLTGNAIHVWRATLTSGPLSTLSPKERARAARFRFDAHRQRFIAARGVLRDVLSRYTGQPAASLRFAYNTYGKPALPDHNWLQFNLSHSSTAPANSDGIALIAVTRGRPVGIDVERIAAPDNMARLVEQFFSATENAAFRALPPEQREAAFFTGWTRKEAYIKALGVGVSLPLDRFDVTLAPKGNARLLADRANPGNALRWALHNIDAGPGYAAALAVRKPLGAITYYQWECSQIVK